MLDFNHLANQFGATMDVQNFTATTSTTSTTSISPGWQSWRKPRGIKYVFLVGAGGGSSGAVGANTAVTNAGGAGGGSGGYTVVLIPALFVPDVLYIQCGPGGQQPNVLVSAATQVGGSNTYVSVEGGNAIANTTLLVANGGASDAVTAGTVATLAQMNWASRGQYNFFAGTDGSTGGAANTVGTALAVPTTGCPLGGGTGGGGSGATAGAGGSITSPAVNSFQFFLPTTAGGLGAVTSTPAGAGMGGLVLPYFLFNYGGLGGGGASATSGGIAGAGGNGAPGAGGGGGGGASSTAGITTLARPGAGGPGFVTILSW